MREEQPSGDQAAAGRRPTGVTRDRDGPGWPGARPARRYGGADRVRHQATFLNIATGVPVPLTYAAVGVVVARNQPRNPVGWILILFVVLFLIPVDAGYYAVLRYRLGDHGLPLGPVAVTLVAVWPLAFAVFPLVILHYSVRFGGGSSTPSTGASTGPGMTPSRW